MFIGECADEWLEQRGCELVRQRDQADVAVVQAQLRFQDRINRGDERLERVVYEMGEAKREENPEHGRGGGRRFDIVVDASRRAVCWRFTRWAHSEYCERSRAWEREGKRGWRIANSESAVVDKIPGRPVRKPENANLTATPTANGACEFGGLL